ncbi:hypothetical protein [Streptomyces sp. SID12488]|nr:hypothetical protein [Streptomyces sp. SID12488]NEA65479.1 hypothetical protein [Streptomyces sp. SID12488]
MVAGLAGAAHAEVAVRYDDTAPGYRLNVSSNPGTDHAIVRLLAEGARCS